MHKLKKTITKIKRKVMRRHVFSTTKFQKLVELGIHYKL